MIVIMEYKKLFTPFKIGSMEVKNRIVFSPIGINASNIDGTISNDEIDYYEERARGGVGMIIMGAQFISQDIAQGPLSGILEHTYIIPQLTTICEAVQKIWNQNSCPVMLWHRTLCFSKCEWRTINVSITYTISL